MKRFLSKNLLAVLLSIVILLMVAVPALAVPLSNLQIPSSMPALDLETGGYVKVEPTGCCERKGMVQVRLSMYLYPGDYNYNKCHLWQPIIPAEGYPGKVVDTMGTPASINDYNAWINSLPHEWIDVPFHNHFIYIEPSVSNTEILIMAKPLLEQAYSKWKSGQRIDITNKSINFPKVVDSNRLSAVNNKVALLKNAVLKIDGDIVK